MITLLLSTQNLTSLYQNVIGWITVIIDVLTAFVMLYKAIKAKGITFIDLLKTQKGRKRVSEELGKLIEHLEDVTKAEDEEKPENEAKENEIHRTTD